MRAYVGHGRLDTVEQTHLLNLLYEKLGLYHNLFQPVMRLQEKRAKEGASKMQRIYDRAQPPLDRLIAAGVLAPHQQAYLLALRRSINPLACGKRSNPCLSSSFACRVHRQAKWKMST